MWVPLTKYLFYKETHQNAIVLFIVATEVFYSVFQSSLQVEHRETKKIISSFIFKMIFLTYTMEIITPL